MFYSMYWGLSATMAMAALLCQQYLDLQIAPYFKVGPDHPHATHSGSMHACIIASTLCQVTMHVCILMPQLAGMA